MDDAARRRGRDSEGVRMKCPKCGYFSTSGVAAAVKITDKDGYPVDPPTRYTCQRCGHRWSNNAAGKAGR